MIFSSCLRTKDFKNQAKNGASLQNWMERENKHFLCVFPSEKAYLEQSMQAAVRHSMKCNLLGLGEGLHEVSWPPV